MNWVTPLLFILGDLLVCDGIGSICYYWNSNGPDGKRQGFKDHLVRTLRTIAGLIIVVVSVTI